MLLPDDSARQINTPIEKQSTSKLKKCDFCVTHTVDGAVVGFTHDEQLPVELCTSGGNTNCEQFLLHEMKK